MKKLLTVILFIVIPGGTDLFAQTEQYDRVLAFTTSFGFLFFVAYLGMMIHFFKKKIGGESFRDIALYFSMHLKSVLVSVFSTFIGFLGYYLTLSTGYPADIFTVALVGYLSDSLFNKYDNAKAVEKVIDKISNDDVFSDNIKIIADKVEQNK
jgi:hypothetical protein